MRHTQLGDVSEGHWHTRCTHQFQLLYIFERRACGFTEFDNNINLLITIAEYSCLCAFKRIARGEGDFAGASVHIRSLCPHQYVF